jgi:DUF4097 and DUF4098 domain-containing protein YvlB
MTSVEEEQYNYNLSAELGNIKLNGNKHPICVKENTDAENKLTIFNRNGDINVAFKK